MRAEVVETLPTPNWTLMGSCACGARFSHEHQPDGTVAEVCRPCRTWRIIPRRPPTRDELAGSFEGVKERLARTGWDLGEQLVRLRALAVELDRTPTMHDWDAAGFTPKAHALGLRVGGWCAVCEAADLEPTRRR